MCKLNVSNRSFVVEPKTQVQPNAVKNKTENAPQVTTNTQKEQTKLEPKDNIQVQTKNNNVITGKEVTAPVNNTVTNMFAKGLADKAKSEEISPKGATEFSQEETDKIIKAAEKHGKELFPKSETNAADSAWAWSLQKRNQDPKDVNWAAAEHYLYAKSRSKESKVEGVTMGVLAAGYDIVKAGLFAIGKEELLSGTGKAEDISKPTLGSTLSGIKGAIDGF